MSQIPRVISPSIQNTPQLTTPPRTCQQYITHPRSIKNSATHTTTTHLHSSMAPSLQLPCQPEHFCLLSPRSPRQYGWAIAHLISLTFTAHHFSDRRQQILSIIIPLLPFYFVSPHPCPIQVSLSPLSPHTIAYHISPTSSPPHALHYLSSIPALASLTILHSIQSIPNLSQPDSLTPPRQLHFRNNETFGYPPPRMHSLCHTPRP